jgi:LPXTG-motif cell wall-anchored protein
VSTSISSPSRMRRIVAAGAFSAVLALGAGTAAAQDQHSGGVSPNEEVKDTGVNPTAVAKTEVAGTSVSRGGLPITGSDVAGLVAVGAAAIAVGSGAVVVSKRRTRLSA